MTEIKWPTNPVSPTSIHKHINGIRGMYYYTSSSKLESSSSVLSSRFDIDGVWPAIVAVSAPPSQTDFIHCVQFGMQLATVLPSVGILCFSQITQSCI